MNRDEMLEIFSFAFEVWHTSPIRRGQAERVMDIIEENIGQINLRPPSARIIQRPKIDFPDTIQPKRRQK